MKYYHRYGEDGTCEVICTRCFLTLGFAKGMTAVRDVEAGHICSEEAVPEEAAGTFPGNYCAQDLGRVEKGRSQYEKNGIVNLIVVTLGIVCLLYALPTVAEIGASRVVNPWIAVILPGDLLGCVWLIAGLKMYRTGAALYLLLTVCEACLYWFRVVPSGALLWIVDAVPTLVATVLVARTRMTNRPGLRAAS